MKPDLKSALLGGAASAPIMLEPETAPKKQPPRVMVGIPSGNTWMARTATAVAGLCAYTGMNGISLGVVGLEGSVISKQRNDLVNIARQHKMDYILQIDSDLVFPPDALLRLLKHDKDIVGATYNKRVAPYETLGRLEGDMPDDPGKTPLCKAIFLPGGFMLMKMSVFERIPPPWYFETYAWPGETGTDALKNYVRSNYTNSCPESALSELDGSNLSKWADEIWPEERKFMGASYVSEDINFSRLVRRHGLEMWCDLQLTWEIKHLGILEVTCLPPTEQALIVPASM